MFKMIERTLKFFDIACVQKCDQRGFSKIYFEIEVDEFGNYIKTIIGNDFYLDSDSVIFFKSEYIFVWLLFGRDSMANSLMCGFSF